MIKEIKNNSIDLNQKAHNMAIKSLSKRGKDVDIAYQYLAVKATYYKLYNGDINEVEAREKITEIFEHREAF